MALQSIVLSERLKIAHALTGAVDRWRANRNPHSQDAEVIYQGVVRVYRTIGLQVDAARLKRRITTPTSQENADILIGVIQQLISGSKNFKAVFGLDEWNRYLPTRKQSHYDVIFVGGGPIGLWTAILTKVHSAALSILVFEKRIDYVRGHTLTIEHDSFNDYPMGSCPPLDQIVEDFKSRRNVRIKEVEERLLSLAQSLGIQIEFASITNPAELLTTFPSTTVFIGSDGARSTLRSHIFNDASRLLEPIHRLVQINYQIKKMVTRNFNLKNQKKFAYTTIASMNTTLIDERTSQTAQIADKTLTFVVSENLFEKMKRATFAAPFKVTSPNLPSDLLADFYLWCGMKEETDGEVRILNSEKIVGIDGLARISKAFVKADQGRIWCLLGDAAASFPLQRGFNVGLQSGVKLAKALTNFFNHPQAKLVQLDGAEGQIPEPFTHYTSFGVQIEDKELCFLQCPLTEKKLGITVWKLATKAGQIFPGIATLDATTVERYKNIGQNPGNTAMGNISCVQQRIDQALADYRAPDSNTSLDGLSTMERIQQQLREYQSG